MSMATSPKSPPLFAAIKRALVDKYPLVVWFFAINVAVGLAGFWAPLIPEIRHGSDAIISRTLELLRSGGAYTFLIAYLASASGYLITEYVDRSAQFFRNEKAALVGFAFVIGVFSIAFTIALFSGSTRSTLAPVVTADDWIQIGMTVIAIVLGFLLLLLQWAGTYSFEAFLDQSQKADKSTAEALMSHAGQSAKYSAQEVVEVKGKKVKI